VIIGLVLQSISYIVPQRAPSATSLAAETNSSCTLRCTKTR